MFLHVSVRYIARHTLRSQNGVPCLVLKLPWWIKRRCPCLRRQKPHDKATGTCLIVTVALKLSKVCFKEVEKKNEKDYISSRMPSSWKKLFMHEIEKLKGSIRPTLP